MLSAAKMLQEAGAAMIDVSGGFMGHGCRSSARLLRARGFAVKKAVTIPVMSQAGSLKEASPRRYFRTEPPT